MKRRLFLRSALAAVASVALAQSIACARLESLIERPLKGWTFYERHVYPDGSGAGWGRGESLNDESGRRIVQRDGWMTLERWNGSHEPIVEIPTPGDGRTLDFRPFYG